MVRKMGFGMEFGVQEGFGRGRRGIMFDIIHFFVEIMNGI